MGVSGGGPRGRSRERQGLWVRCLSEQFFEEGQRDLFQGLVWNGLLQQPLRLLPSPPQDEGLIQAQVPHRVHGFSRSTTESMTIKSTESSLEPDRVRVVDTDVGEL